MRGDVVERCATGIKGFDSLCQGGFVRNSNNVLVGGPGSGKTTFMLQFLWSGLTQFNENGLYCSFEPDILETLNDAASFGWDFSKFAEQNRVKFLKFSPETSVQELKKELTNLVSKYQIRRICFDPVSVLALSLSEKGAIRGRVFELVSLMKRLHVTSILADESFENGQSNSINEEWAKSDIIRFLADSVVMLYEGGLQGVSDRALRINKMRRTSHNRNFAGMVINENGIEVIPQNSGV